VRATRFLNNLHQVRSKPVVSDNVYQTVINNSRQCLSDRHQQQQTMFIRPPSTTGPNKLLLRRTQLEVEVVFWMQETAFSSSRYSFTLLSYFKTFLIHDEHLEGAPC